MNRDLSMRTRPTFLYDLRVAVANEYDEVRSLSSSDLLLITLLPGQA